MSHYRRILLHVGLSKTGSTSIQANCARHREVLARFRVRYPVFDLAGEPQQNHSLALVLAVTASPGRYILGIDQRYPGELSALARSASEQLDAALASGGDTLLLSTELVENFEPADMAALRDRLASHARSLEVIGYLRSPHDTLESLLQERLKAGAVLEPQSLLGRVRGKVENLEAAFGAALQLVNYHTARNHAGGVTGDFLARIGLQQGVLSTLELRGGNERMSLECFRLMRAINLRYPRKDVARHGVARHPGDLDALLSLPGEPFHLEGFTGSGLHAALLDEAAWLERHLGMSFPPLQAHEPGEPWQAESVAALPGVLRRLGRHEFSDCAADFLAGEAAALAAARPDTAAALRAVAER